MTAVVHHHLGSKLFLGIRVWITRAGPRRGLLQLHIDPDAAGGRHGQGKLPLRLHTSARLGPGIGKLISVTIGDPNGRNAVARVHSQIHGQPSPLGSVKASCPGGRHSPGSYRYLGSSGRILDHSVHDTRAGPGGASHDQSSRQISTGGVRAGGIGITAIRKDHIDVGVILRHRKCGCTTIGNLGHGKQDLLPGTSLDGVGRHHMVPGIGCDL